MARAGVLRSAPAKPNPVVDESKTNEDSTVSSPKCVKQATKTSMKTRRSKRKAPPEATSDPPPAIPALSPASSPIAVDSESDGTSSSPQERVKKYPRTNASEAKLARKPNTKAPKTTAQSAVTRALKTPKEEGSVDAGVHETTPQRLKQRPSHAPEQPTRKSARVAPLPDPGRVFEPCHPETLPGSPALHGKPLLEDRKYALYNGVVLPAVYCASDMRRYVNGELANLAPASTQRRLRRRRNRRVKWQEELEW